jgi:DNA mismatch endonuclease, patch repair protein
MNKIIVPRFKNELGYTTTKSRSILMGKIRSAQTKPEKVLRKALWHTGIRFRINSKKLPGKPDIVIKKYNLIIFVDGEFWHGYNWEEKKLQIKTNRGFWIPKVERNMQRDKENNRVLSLLVYRVLRFWGHSVKKDLQGCVDIILTFAQMWNSIEWN